MLHNFLTEPRKDIAALMARLNPEGNVYLGPNAGIQPIPYLRDYHSSNEAQCVMEHIQGLFCRTAWIYSLAR